MLVPGPSGPELHVDRWQSGNVRPVPAPSLGARIMVGLLLLGAFLVGYFTCAIANPMLAMARDKAIRSGMLEVKRLRAEAVEVIDRAVLAQAKTDQQTAKLEEIKKHLDRVAADQRRVVRAAFDEEATRLEEIKKHLDRVAADQHKRYLDIAEMCDSIMADLIEKHPRSAGLLLTEMSRRWGPKDGV